MTRFGRGRGKNRGPRLATTTLWNYASHHVGAGFQGDQQYVGATPAFIQWNLMQRYTKKGDVVVDPFCGSGTTLDVAAELERRAVGFDVSPYRPGIHRADAREIPLDDAVADLVFIDPPYADNVKYSNDKACLGRYRAGDPRYYAGLAKALDECLRILKPGGVFACYVCDHYATKTGFEPIGFKLFSLIQERFRPLDVIAVVRHNKTLKEDRWHRGARRGGFFLRGFNYLFIAAKDEGPCAICRRRPEPRPQGRSRWQGAQAPQGRPRRQGAQATQDRPRRQGAQASQSRPRRQGAQAAQGRPRRQGAQTAQGIAPSARGADRPRHSPVGTRHPRPAHGRGFPHPMRTRHCSMTTRGLKRGHGGGVVVVHG